MDSPSTSTRLERIQGCIAAGNYQDGEVFRGVRPKQLSDEPINALSTAATLSIETSGPMGSLFDSSTDGVTGELSKSRILDPGPLKALPL
jgi:hypothetical protein